MFFGLVVVWLFLAIGFLTGATHRWLRARGIARQPAAVVQALVIALVFTALWVLADPAQTPIGQLWVFWIWQFLVAYGAVLLRLRWMRPS